MSVLARHYRSAAVAAVVVTTIETTSLTRGNPLAVISLVVLLILVAAALLLARDPEQRGNAALLETSAVFAATAQAGDAFGQFGTQIGFAADWWAIASLAWFFLRYPDRAIRTRWHRWLFALIVASGVGLWAVDTVLWDPVRVGVAEPNRWITLGDWEAFRDHLQLVAAWALALALLGGCGALIGRWRAARGLARPAIAWVACTGAALAAFCAVTIWLEWVLPWYIDHNLGDLGPYRTTALGLATVVLFLEAVRRRSAAVGVIDRLLGAGNDTDGVVDVLRRAFSDPTVRLHLTDIPAGLPAGRLALPLSGRDGSHLGMVETDESALIDPAWTRTVLTAAGVVLDNARLHASVVDSLAEVRSSRARLVEAGLTERRRVERDLHDGAQQHLLAVASSLGRLELADRDRAGRKAALTDAKSQLDVALAELRRLARGIYPPVLTQAGLAAALRTLPDTTAVPVELDVAAIEARRFGSATESTAWFVACEAVANAVKHAAPDRITITVHPSADALTVIVEDNGCGGAVVTPGGGLAGLVDRVRALGGDAEVHTVPGRGSTVRARVPVT